MKKAILTAVLSAIVLSALPVHAQQATRADRGARAKAVAPNVQEFDKQMAQVQENMKKMHEQMDKIHETQNPEARQKLLQDHWATMQNNMQMMHGMWGTGMRGCCAGGPNMDQSMMDRHMMGGPMWGDYGRLTPEQLAQRQYMMEQYMPMQQMMMEHMMQHQQWMWQRPPSK